MDSTGVKVWTSVAMFDADFAFVTLPLGVLKKGSVEFWPALPKLKLAVIERMEMGLLDKVALRFPKVFWPKDAHFLGYISETKGEFPTFLNLYLHTVEPILFGLCSAGYAASLEKKTDLDAVGKAVAALRKMYGDAVPNPTGFRVTRWASDPFTYGSYSCLPVCGRTWRLRPAGRTDRQSALLRRRGHTPPLSRHRPRRIPLGHPGGGTDNQSRMKSTEILTHHFVELYSSTDPHYRLGPINSFST